MPQVTKGNRALDFPSIPRTDFLRHLPTRNHRLKSCSTLHMLDRLLVSSVWFERVILVLAAYFFKQCDFYKTTTSTVQFEQEQIMRFAAFQLVSLDLLQLWRKRKRDTFFWVLQRTPRQPLPPPSIPDLNWPHPGSSQSTIRSRRSRRLQGFHPSYLERRKNE